MRSSDTYRGDDWIGLKMRDASVVRGIGVLPMFAGLLGLLLLVGALAATWARKAAKRPRVRPAYLPPLPITLSAAVMTLWPDSCRSIRRASCCSRHLVEIDDRRRVLLA